MFFLMSGSLGSGKSTVGPEVARVASDLVFHDSDERYSTETDRIERLEGWVRTALEYQARGQDMLLGAQAPLGELLACPSAVELEAIAGCVLDCADVERVERVRARGPESLAHLGMDMLCWACFHRMHASDPAWEQHCIATPERAHLPWSRWTHWTRSDPRWSVPVIDTTATALTETAQHVAAWINDARTHPPLTRDARWWTQP